MIEAQADVLVIGAGPGGYVAAIRLAQLGRKVIVAEKARAGGICLTLGCIPTKALLHAVHTLRLAREGAQIGLAFGEPEKDIAKLGAWRNRVVDRHVRGVEYLFKQNGVEQIKAQAEFVDAHRVRLNSLDGSATMVTADHIIIATGSEPQVLPGLEPDGAKVITSNEAVMLTSVPSSILIIGAGAIGLEFASIYAGLGSRVTVVEIMDQVVPGTDRELAALLERILKKQRIEILLQSKVARIEKGAPCRIAVQHEEGAGDEGRGTSPPDFSPPTPHPSSLIEADQVLVAVGRRPLTHGLAIENSGVKFGPRGFIEVNDQLQTSVPGIFAIGDVARAPLLAHKASHEGLAVAEQIAQQAQPEISNIKYQISNNPTPNTQYLTPNTQHPVHNTFSLDLRAVPNCVYTDPELATVGLTEAEAIAAGYEVVVGKVPLSALGRATTINRLEGLCKVVADRRTDLVLGVHILAPEASSLIGEAVLAIANGLTTRSIGAAVHPHPSFGELLMETAEAVHGEAIHIVNPKA